MADSLYVRRRLCYLLSACLTAMILSPFAMAQEKDDDEKKSEKKPTTPAYLIKIPLPITGGVDGLIKRKVDQLLDRLPRDLPAGSPRPVLIFEFGVEAGQTGQGSEFERALALARFLTGPQFRSVRTVAYLPHGVQGHAVLAVLACEQIIMHPEAELGRAGIDEESIDSTLRTIYSDIARKRLLINETVVQGMLDAQAEVYRVTTIEDEVRYVLTDEYKKLDAAGQIQNAETIVLAGQLANFKGDQLRDKFQFVSHLVEDRRELARALEIPSGVIEEDPALGEKWKPVRIELKGPVNNKTIHWVLSSLYEKTRDGQVNLVILDIDSAGGDPALSMTLANQLADLDSNRIRTLAYVSRMAKGDASLIALACDHLVIEEGAILGGPGNYRLSGKSEREKTYESIRALAQKKSRDWSLIAALLDTSLTVHRYTRQGPYEPRYFCPQELQQQKDNGRWERQEEIDTQKGLTARRAEELNLARTVVTGWEQVKQLYQLTEEPEQLQPNWANAAISDFAQKLDNAWLKRTLMFIAFAALMTEISSPGIGVPGFISAVCFTFFFWIQILSGNAYWLEVLLFAVGLACLAIEIFVIPGFGIFGIGGAIMVVLSIILASQTFIVPSTSREFDELTNSLSMILIAGAGVGVAMFFMRNVLHKTPVFSSMMLKPPQGDQLDDLHQRESMVDHSHLVGQRGLTTTQLTPTGKARFDGEPVDVISDGELIPKGTQVQVVQVTGHHIHVATVEEEAATL